MAFPATTTVTTTVTVVTLTPNPVFMPRAPITVSSTETLVPVNDKSAVYTQWPAIFTSNPAKSVTVNNGIVSLLPQYQISSFPSVLVPVTDTSKTYTLWPAIFTSNPAKSVTVNNGFITAQPQYQISSFPSVQVPVIVPTTNYSPYTFIFRNIPASVSITTAPNLIPVTARVVAVYNPNNNLGLPGPAGINWFVQNGSYVTAVQTVDQVSAAQPATYQPEPINTTEFVSYTNNTVGNNATQSSQVNYTITSYTPGSSRGVATATDANGLYVSYQPEPINTTEVISYTNNTVGNNATQSSQVNYTITSYTPGSSRGVATATDATGKYVSYLSNPVVTAEAYEFSSIVSNTFSYVSTTAQTVYWAMS
jgi:hypothetical protein